MIAAARIASISRTSISRHASSPSAGGTPGRARGPGNRAGDAAIEPWLARGEHHGRAAHPLLRELRKADRMGASASFIRMSPGWCEGTCVDVHSKVMVIDDEWLRIGSANICNRSMGMDTECDLTVEARGEPAIGKTIAGFRDRLIAEHLDVEPHESSRPAGNGITDRRDRIHAWQQRTLKTLTQLKEMAGCRHRDGGARRSRQAGDATCSSSNSPPWRRAPTAALAAPADRHCRAGLIRRAVALHAALAIRQARARHRPRRTLLRAWWAPLVLMLAYTPASLTMFPRPLITLFAIVAFGAYLGAAYALLGIMVAAAVTIWMGAWLEPARAAAGRPQLNRISEILRERGLLAMTAVRLVPVAPFAVEGSWPARSASSSGISCSGRSSASCRGRSDDRVGQQISADCAMRGISTTGPSPARPCS